MPRSPLPRAGGADSPATLDDAALLALFTTSGTALCQRAGGLRPALELPDAELEAAGMTPTEIHRLRAALELGARYVSSAVARGESLTSPAATLRALEARLCSARSATRSGEMRGPG